MKCIHCGKVLPDNAIKCYSCGQSTGRNSKTQKQTPPSNSRQSNTQYGQVIKCPACGGMINPFQTQCVCGYVFRGTNTVTAVSDLAQEIQALDSQSTANPYSNSFNGGVDIFEHQKIALITNFIIPNLKEELIEFALLSRVNLAKIYSLKRPLNDALYNAWKTKFEECHIKAKMMLSSGDLVLFNSIEKEMQSYESKLQAKKSKIRIFSIIGIVVSSIQLMAAISFVVIPCIVLSIFELGAFVLTLLLETKVIKTKNIIFKIFSLIAGIILFFANVGIMSTKGVKEVVASQDDVETIVWSDFEIGDQLPEFGKTEAEVVSDNEKNLILYFYDIEKKEFKEYVGKCERFGYEIDKEKGDNSFLAYKEGNCKLRLTYSDYFKELRIELEIIQMSELQIINSTILGKIPALPSTYGKIVVDSEKKLSFYLGNVTFENYKSYVQECYDKGFNQESTNTEKRFNAKKGIGKIGKDYELTITYQGNNIIFVEIEQIE